MSARLRRPASPKWPALGDQHAPLREQVAEAIRHAILDGRFRPGERLVEEGLALDLGVSRNPVREALRALAAEGLVDLRARRGAAVAQLGAETAQEMVEVRATLEGLNARLAARRRAPQSLRRLEAILERGSVAAREGRVASLTSLNAEFHDALAAAGSNRVLADLMRSLRERTSAVFPPLGGDRAVETWAEHAEILRAVIAGDADLAALLATRHVLNAGADYLARQAQTAGQTAAS